MVDQLRSFSSEVTRVAREVGTEGKLGGQAYVGGVSGVWKDLTDNVNTLAGNLTARCGTSPRSRPRSQGDLSRKITVEAAGEVAELKNTVNTMVASSRRSPRGHARRARGGHGGRLGGQAEVEGSPAWRALTENVNTLAATSPRRCATSPRSRRRREGRPTKQITVEAAGEVARSRTRSTRWSSSFRVRGRGHPRRARGRHRGPARRPAQVEGVRVARLTESVNYMASNLTAGAEHRRGHHGVHRRPEEGHGRRQGRGARAQEDDQHDGRPARVRGRGHARRARGRHRGPPRRPGAGQGRQRRLARPDRERELPRRQPHHPGAEHRRRDDRRRERRPLAARSRSSLPARSPS